MTPESGDIALISLLDSSSAKLREQIRYLDEGSAFPGEMVVCQSTSEGRVFDAANFPVRHLYFEDRFGGPHFAKACNEAVKSTSAERIVFIKSDCIPGKHFVRDFAACEHMDRNLYQGDVRSLSRHLFDLSDTTPESLDTHSTPDAAFLEDSFFGVSFAISRATFEEIGGFDERFSHEKLATLDFALRATAAAKSILPCPARSWLRYRYTPETNFPHMATIVDDSCLFFRQWETWPLKSQLDKLASAGVVEFNEDAGKLMCLVL